MRSTIELFKQLYQNLPPGVPAKVKTEMRAAITKVENNPNLSLEQLEKIMIGYGYAVWPWNKAFQEFLDAGLRKVGEHFLLPKLPPELQTKFNEYKAYGGSLEDLQLGHSAAFFNSIERQMLAPALVETRREVRAYAEREALGEQNKKYLKRVTEFTKILEEIDQTLKRLTTLAEKEQDHPNLAGEIKARVRAFEYGLCYLGPKIEFDEVGNAEEFFKGRKKELNRLKGIPVPIEIDFYVEESADFA